MILREGTSHGTARGCEGKVKIPADPGSLVKRDARSLVLY